MTRVTFARFSSPLGTLTALSRDHSITDLWLPAQNKEIPNGAVEEFTPELQALKIWLEQYFQGKNPIIDFPLTPQGTAFQRQVWDLLQEIPYGESLTYGALAKTLGTTMSAQAVGQAVGKNPISILIPCHRVLGSGNKLTGYAGGIPAKMLLLELEHIPYKIR